MKEWYERLSSREQFYVSFFGFVLLAILIFLFLIEPIQINNDKVLNRLKSARTMQVFMQDIAKKSAMLREFQSNQMQHHDKANLFGSVENGLKSAGISSDLTSISPGKQGSVRLRFDDVSFDKFIQWLIKTHNRYGLVVDSLNVSNTTKIGRVRISVEIY